eukprot:scaffold574_cov333-Pavlova_lutheri.AAC.19
MGFTIVSIHGPGPSLPPSFTLLSRLPFRKGKRVRSIPSLKGEEGSLIGGGGSKGRLSWTISRQLRPTRSTRFDAMASSSLRNLNPNAELMGSAAALFMNLNAAKGLEDVLRTNLGPRGTIKMLVGGAGGKSERRRLAPWTEIRAKWRDTHANAQTRVHATRMRHEGSTRCGRRR